MIFNSRKEKKLIIKILYERINFLRNNDNENNYYFLKNNRELYDEIHILRSLIFKLKNIPVEKEIIKESKIDLIKKLFSK